MNKHKQIIKIGSRGSQLALRQVREVHDLLKNAGTDLNVEPVLYETEGDRNQTISLTSHLADDFFTDTLDRALLEGGIDAAVHSAKDLPQILNENLKIFALTKTVDDTDAFVGKVKFGELKKGAKIGTSSLLRQTSIKELNPSLVVLDIRGNIQKRLKLMEEGQYDGVIVATAALKRLGLEHLIKDIMPWEATPLQGQLAVVGRKDDQELQELFSAIDERPSYGRVILVGAGPGDPELITQKGVKVLARADCVFYDYLIHKDLLNHAPQAEKIYVGKRKGAHTLSQGKLSKMLKDKALSGKTVVRLKGGDPLIFGRGADEITYLRSFHIQVEVVPGVSSATAVPSSLGVPLTARDVSSSVAFLSAYSRGETDSDDKLLEIPNVDTIVFMMGLTKLDIIVESLLKAGWKEDSSIMVISKGTYVDERVISGTLKNIKAAIHKEKLELPALIVAGEVVQFAKRISREKENILYTGTNPEKYTALGNIVHLPMIEIQPISLDSEKVQALKKNITNYHIILFTSRFAVKYFFELLKKEDFFISDLKIKDFIVIGRQTAQALRKYGFEPMIVSDIETSQGLLSAVASQYPLKGKKILFPRSALPNPYLEEELTKLGSQVDTLAIYQNLKPAKRNLPDASIDKVLFTSPSTVRNFLSDYESIPKNWKILSRGPLTHDSLEEAGYKNEVVLYE